MTTSSPGYPSLVRIRQHFPRPRVEGVAATAGAEAAKLLERAKIGPGKRVGITAGSRGIRNIAPMLRAVIAAVRERGATPVILAAMGSHGGGTEEGQRAMLEGLGLTEETLGAPIVACAQSRDIGVTAGGLHAYMLESAFTVDAIIPMNRVKIHTSFHGDLESGTIKKLVVGLGGPAGARQFHSIGRLSALSPLLREVGRLILDTMPVIGGIAIVENAYEETASVTAMYPEEMLDKESALLAYSRSLMPALPVNDLDALFVEEMGKNFSGTGLDCNIVGRLLVQGEPEPASPAIRYLGVFNLAEQSHGNAMGVGFADFVTQKLVDAIDRKATYLNCLTTTFPQRVRIPLTLGTEKELVDTVLRCLAGSATPETVRLAVIPNTLFLTEMFVSEAVYAELRDKETVEVLQERVPLVFDASGAMIPRIGNIH